MDPTTDALRGHDWLPAEAALAPVPALYETERTALADKTIHLHYFVGSCDWYVAELDPDRRLAFGYVDLGDPQSAEWGYFDMDELRSLSVRHPSGVLLVVERDLHWTPTLFSEVESGREG